MASTIKLIANIAGAEDWAHDPWGTASSLHFDVASVLDMSDVEGDVTPEPFARWDYHPAPYTRVPSLESVAARAPYFSEGEWADDHTYGEISLAAALVAGQITQADLIHAGDVLSRYARLCVAAGRDY